MGCIDHLVWSTPDLDLGIRQIEELTGVQPVAGGSHPGAGTRNALLPLGEHVYLEIIGPDPDQADYRSPRVFRIDTIDKPGLVTWAARSKNLQEYASSPFADGQSLGEVSSMSRRRTDGVILKWELTDPYVEVDGGVVPFLIDWGDTPHPASSAVAGLTLSELQLRHPNPRAVTEKLAAIDINLPVDQAPRAELIASIDTPRGQVQLGPR